MHASCDSGKLNRFYIWNSVNDHSCGGGLINLRNLHLSNSYVKSLIIDELRDHPNRKASDFGRKYNLEFFFFFFKCRKQFSLMELHGSDSMSYKDLSWYLEALKKHNPSSYIDMDVNVYINQFGRVFIGLNACFKHCQAMIFLNAIHFKGRSWVLMRATANNDNRDTFFLDVVLCYANMRVLHYGK